MQRRHAQRNRDRKEYRREDQDRGRDIEKRADDEQDDVYQQQYYDRIVADRQHAVANRLRNILVG